jgi:hypothetical protein
MKKKTYKTFHFTGLLWNNKLPDGFVWGQGYITVNGKNYMFNDLEKLPSIIRKAVRANKQHVVMP